MNIGNIYSIYKKNMNIGNILTNIAMAFSVLYFVYVRNSFKP